MSEFEGSLILEQLAEFGLVDEFYDAIDADNIQRITLLMRKAQIDEEQIQLTIGKVLESEV